MTATPCARSGSSGAGLAPPPRRPAFCLGAGRAASPAECGATARRSACGCAAPGASSAGAATPRWPGLGADAPMPLVAAPAVPDAPVPATVPAAWLAAVAAAPSTCAAREPTGRAAPTGHAPAAPDRPDRLAPAPPAPSHAAVQAVHHVRCSSRWSRQPPIADWPAGGLSAQGRQRGSCRARTTRPPPVSRPHARKHSICGRPPVGLPVKLTRWRKESGGSPKTRVPAPAVPARAGGAVPAAARLPRAPPPRSADAAAAARVWARGAAVRPSEAQSELTPG
eukprot:scaffold33052_cov107-Isochrysis_galbana.AAC.5